MTAPIVPDVHGDRRRGMFLALGTASVSGVAVFVNSYGVRRFDDATVYTTAKNLVAAIVILGVTGLARTLGPTPQPAASSTRGGTSGRARGDHALLAAVALIGGALPFVLFFEGLSRVSSPDAAYIHKTLLVWVAMLSVPFLGERLAPWHFVAIGVLLLGEAELRGGVGWPGVGSGELLILAATLCWAVEVVISKRLLGHHPPLVLSVSRMAGGAVILVGWVFASGRGGDLVALGASQWGWALLTGALLSAYVISWHHALAAAPAIDVSAVLVAGALVTTLLDWVVIGTPLEPLWLGLVLITVGVAIVVLAPRRPRPRTQLTATGR